MIAIRRLVVLFCVAAISACSSPRPRDNAAKVEDLEGRSEVFVFRESKEASTDKGYCVKLDGVPIGTLTNGSFLRKVVNPGWHMISIPSSGQLSLEIEPEANDKSFLVFSIGLESLKETPTATTYDSVSVDTAQHLSLIATTKDYGQEKLKNLLESQSSSQCIK